MAALPPNLPPPHQPAASRRGGQAESKQPAAGHVDCDLHKTLDALLDIATKMLVLQLRFPNHPELQKAYLAVVMRPLIKQLHTGVKQQLLQGNIPKAFDLFTPVYMQPGCKIKANGRTLQRYRAIAEAAARDGGTAGVCQALEAESQRELQQRQTQGIEADQSDALLMQIGKVARETLDFIADPHNDGGGE